MQSGAHFSSEDHDWVTPPGVFLPIAQEFGPTLDVCATPFNTKCPQYYTAKDNGLEKVWSYSGHQVCWMNPPYGRALAKWVAKAHAESLRGVTTICLVPARPDTAWWHEHALFAEIRFIRGRIYFLNTDGHKPIASERPAFPSCLLIFGRAPGLSHIAYNAGLRGLDGPFMEPVTYSQLRRS